MFALHVTVKKLEQDRDDVSSQNLLIKLRAEFYSRKVRWNYS